MTDNPRLTRIEWGTLEGVRPRSAGRNARLPEHGIHVREPMARITFDDGSSGFGFSRITKTQAEALLGKPLNDLISLDSGISARSRDAEFPLWDTLGQRAGKPVYQLLADHYGVAAPESFSAPCYDTTLYFDDLHLESDMAAAALIADEAKQGYARGHRAFKIKVGRGALHLPLIEGTQRDIAIIHAVREAVGPGLPVMIDANNGWNVNLVKWVLTETAGCAIHWLEEPFHEDRVLYAHLREWMQSQNLSVLIADGEGQAAPNLLDWAREGVIDVVQYDLRAYGFGEWLKTGRQLDSWGATSAPHNYGSGYGNYASAHLAGVLEKFSFVEWDHIDLDGLDASGYTLREGRVNVPAAPGFGLQLDESVFVRAVQAEGFVVSS